MSRPKSTLPTFDEVIALNDVEDRIVNLLDGNPHVAAIQAVKLADLTAGLWEIAKNAMLRRDDPRPVFLDTENERCWLGSAVDRCSQDPQWHTCSVSNLFELLAGLPPDEAAFVSYWVAQWAYRRAGFK